MLTRRSFVLSTAMATATLPAIAAAGAAPDPASRSLPAALKALRSRRHEAVPISPDERSQRHERARELMAANQLDAILLAEGTSLEYFCGVSWWGSERLFAAVIPAKGEPFYVCPAFEEGRAREQLTKGPSAGARADVRTWQEDESPYQRVAEGLSDRGLSTARVGLEENVRFVFSEGVARAAPNVSYASATPVTAGCRVIKSAHELALMKLASEVTLAAYEATYHSLRMGMTGHEVTELSRLAHEQLGFEGAADLVLIGEAAAFPHGTVAPSHLAEGKLVLLDGGCNVEGYKSDISRTFVLGKPSAKMQTVFSLVQQAQRAALAAARPGAECGSVDAAARKVIVDGGYGPDYKYFTHRLGHGLGMDGHEWPYLVRGNATKLVAGITTSNEPGIYIRGEFGVRLEDDMVVTDSGARLLTPQSRSLEEPFKSA